MPLNLPNVTTEILLDVMPLMLKYLSLLTNTYEEGGRHSSMVLSAPTILGPRVRIPSTPSMLFSIFIEIVTRKEH